jgi:hypothetical protein
LSEQKGVTAASVEKLEKTERESPRLGFESHAEEDRRKGEKFADLQTRPTQLYLYAFERQKQVLYFRIIRMDH